MPPRLTVYKLHTETASCLTPPTHEALQDRSKRTLSLAAIAAGALGLFGSRVALGTSDCGIADTFGTC